MKQKREAVQIKCFFSNANVFTTKGPIDGATVLANRQIRGRARFNSKMKGICEKVVNVNEFRMHFEYYKTEFEVIPLLI